MSQPMKISYGLNLAKKTGTAKPGATAKRRAIFGGGDDDESDDDNSGGVFGRKKTAGSKKDDGPVAEKITEFGDDFLSAPVPDTDRKDDKKKLAHRKGHLPPSQPPPSKYKSANTKTDGGAADPSSFSTSTSKFGSDLASALTARKHTEAAEALDPSIYDYDATYDAFKAASSRKTKGDGDNDDDEEARRKPQYMSNIRKMAEVRERDRRIAEDKKMQREREAEGDTFDDKETFVTEAYKQQQEENKKLEEAERRREEDEAAKAAETGGMTGFYKQLLERDEQRQAAIQEAIEQSAKAKDERKDEDKEKEKEESFDEKSTVAKAREINAHGGNVAVNDEGEVVDKRQLLQGGLNLSARKRSEIEREKEREARNRDRDRNRDRNAGGGSGSGSSQGVFAGSKQAMRDRQSRMLAAQYEQALKRTRDEEDEQTKAAEEAAKSRKTTADISSAKERYLARKRAEAEAKKAEGGGP